jgi:hypothetical protein
LQGIPRADGNAIDKVRRFYDRDQLNSNEERSSQLQTVNFSRLQYMTVASNPLSFFAEVVFTRQSETTHPKQQHSQNCNKQDFCHQLKD